jgi:hypothetical protein
MTADEKERMQQLCSAITQEQDSETLLNLVEDLNRLLPLKHGDLSKRQAG